LIIAARQKGIPVIYTNDAHHKNKDSELLLWGDHAIKGTKGAQVIDQLKPAKNDNVIKKHHYSGFCETNLDSLLKKLKVDTLIIVGLQAHLCVWHTVADAYQHGYKIIIPQDAINSFTKNDWSNSVKYFKKYYGAQITTVNGIIKEF
jgi:nicotinamidase-related amidase